MSSSNFMPADIASLLGATSTADLVTKSTSRKGNTELNMEDFLQLMIVQLQNQTIDDTMDTSEMMNQMVQMQMITAITNLTDASLMTYASSLVNKLVTVGIVDGDNLEEREVWVTGTGVSNGQQVIFGHDGETYTLNQIMAIGKLPSVDETEGTGNSTGTPSGTPAPGAADETGDNENGEGEGETGEITGSGAAGEVAGDNGADNVTGGDYQGEQGAPTDGTD